MKARSQRIANIFTLVSFLILVVSAVVAHLLPHHYYPQQQQQQQQQPPYRDPSTYSNYWDFVTRSLFLSLEADFNTHQLRGFIEITAERLSTSTLLVLDIQQISIHSVVDLVNSQPLKYSIRDGSKIFGDALIIELPSSTIPAGVGEEIHIKISYETKNTSTDESAIQWLTKEQTKDGKLPFLFTQGEPIHIRSMFPAQDTPSVKATYSAEITVDDIGLVVLMSALKVGEDVRNGKKTFKFIQPVRIPSYLVAMAIGGLERNSIGDPRNGISTGVWSEPSDAQVALESFRDAQKFVEEIEKYLDVKYVWSLYDILVLPPSFPYGGMENPDITFATPTILDPTRSLEDVILHEIAHSWTGNLVTNCKWADFWLNEGFTMFVQRKVTEIIYGKPFADLDAIIGLAALNSLVIQFNNDERTQIVPPFNSSTDPDYFQTQIPYEKGYNFLYYLDSLVGSENMRLFLSSYLKNYSYSCVTTEDWKQSFQQYFAGFPEIDEIDWNMWLYGRGLPPINNSFDSSLADIAINLANDWLERGPAGHSPDDLKDWDSKQKTVFLDQILSLAGNSNFPSDWVGSLDSYYSLSSNNSEVRFRFFLLAVNQDYRDSWEEATDFMSSVGRMKFAVPLYRAFYNVNPEGKQHALETFAKYKYFYHPICRKAIESIFTS